MQIIKRVSVKRVLTEASKETLQQEFEKRKKRLDQECQQLSFEKRKIEMKQNVSREEVAKRFNREIDKRKENIRWLEYQLEQLEILPLGSEIEDGDVESLVELSVGDTWDDVMNEGAIVVQDGKVIRIDK
ncbi:MULTISPECIES: YlqD family protein [Pontibacillus]|uniref:YlqD family protein n=1 Tax=Pontibacillus chungwhensis TaxID=265426 RepID=A0ABY8V390_9BACI|nr:MULTISPECIES: YlqD family protein [Pontibacillus]MCD5322660.1 YlqD family protein [Pontibacillus sp. HN14]WIF99938.1 YlqD family protein [Pontibacillus chungwhensis]